MAMAIFPYLSQIFPEENATELNEILDGVPSDVVLKMASFVNSKLFITDDYKTHREIFNTIIFQEGIEHSEELNQNLTSFEKKHHTKELAIFPLYVVLQLIEHVISNYNAEDKLDNPQKEIAFLKAILFLNGKLDENHKDLNYEKGIHLIWAAAFPQFEYRKNKNPINEMFLAFSLFEFLERRFPVYFSNYLKLYKSENSKELLKEILGLIVGSFNNENKLQSCSFTSESFNKTSILTSFIREMSTFDFADYKVNKKHLYFKGLREKPILRLLDGSYIVTNWNFITDKVRQGVIFDFYNQSGVSSEHLFMDYKSILGQEYSEKDLFIFLIKELFEDDAKMVIHTEDENEDWNFDFYLRFENKILLFEFKDVTISEEVKNSGGDKIWEELQKKFVRNERGRPKGFTQLANLINKINSTPDWIEDYNDVGLEKNRLIIFPIILYTDESCAIPGVNFELNEIFKKQIGYCDFYKIYNPIMIGINVVVEYLFHLKGSPQKLISLLHDYYLSRATYKFGQNGMTNFQVFERIGMSFNQYLVQRFGSLNKFEDSVSLKVVKNKLGLE